jgi:hypothetical protein
MSRHPGKMLGEKTLKQYQLLAFQPMLYVFTITNHCPKEKLTFQQGATGTKAILARTCGKKADNKLSIYYF